MSAPVSYYSERRGTLDYIVGSEVRSFEGWVRLADQNGRTVIIARRIRGRNTWVLTDVAYVVEFRPEEVAA
jgi:hypothetical protein